MQITLATPEKQIFSGEAVSLSVKAEKGELQILDRHADLITLVHPGKVKIQGETVKGFEVSEGVLKIEQGAVSVLCSRIVPI
jgi:F-type H+-transporting ATPase subunit epsilon